MRTLVTVVLGVALALAAVTAASATAPASLETRIHALGCEVGASPGYMDRVVLLPNGDVQRWSFRKLVRETVAERLVWMVGNCPRAERA